VIRAAEHIAYRVSIYLYSIINEKIIHSFKTQPKSLVRSLGLSSPFAFSVLRGVGAHPAMLPAMIPAMTAAGRSAVLDLDRERSNLWRGEAVPLPFTWLSEAA
jgi:hypothetical protein